MTDNATANPATIQRLTMKVASKDGTQSRVVDITGLVIAGWTGRDIKAVHAHIDELARLGVRAPKEVPTFYRASAALLTTSDRVEMLGKQSSGEVEPVLLALSDGLYVGVGSDHTDREVESYSVDVSKQMCHKPVSETLWRFADVEPHWDQLILRSKIRDPGGDWTLYQQGTLGGIRPPRELIEKYPGSRDGKLPEGTVMFCGTFAAHGGIRSAAEFAFEIEDPVLGRRLQHAYHVNTLQISDKPNGH